MRIHSLQHVPFESLEQIAVWAESKGHELTTTLVYEHLDFPSLDTFDMLVILGGPMGVYEEKNYPWLTSEKSFIRSAIAAGKLVLGVCLGAQLIAEQIGGDVYPNPCKEIGWFPVQLMDEAGASVFFRSFPEEFVPFHWHGDTFRLPAEAKKLAFSAGCANQAFTYRDHVIGLQFHLESTEKSIRQLLVHCAGDIEQGDYVQGPTAMSDQLERIRASHEHLYALLDAMEEKHASGATHA